MSFRRFAVAERAGFLAVALFAGCLSTPRSCDQADVAGRLQSRTGFQLSPSRCDSQPVLPNGISLEVGLSEDEAVLIALWNNAAFHEQIAEMGVVRGDLVQAGLLPDPELVYTFAVPDKPFRYAVEMPLEAFWLRPIRLAAAGRESARVCERLTQVALDLIRDTRQAYADVLLAQGRLQVAEDAVRVRGEIARLADARLRAGDVSPQEAATAKVDALQAQQDSARISYDVTLAEERLRNLTGVVGPTTRWTLRPGPLPAAPPPDTEALVDEAIATRPDALAAAEAAAAAADRARLANLVWFRFLGIADATAGQRTGHELGPGFRMVIPIFNRNQGAIARAEAEWERLERARVTVRNQIVLDVRQACLRVAQAWAEFGILERQVRPEAEAQIRRAETAYREGNSPYVVVLEATRQLLDSRLRQAQLEADLRRTWADLERSVGRRVGCGP